MKVLKAGRGFLVVLVLLSSAFAGAGGWNDADQTQGQGGLYGQGNFPTNPDKAMTPGTLCSQADEYRYPEHIKYCRRDVDRDLKVTIIRDYDVKLGYHIQSMDRGEFKIDHLIPLCAGGSNERENLWPQHKTVYAVTDPMEPLVCDKMKAGRLRQSDAVRLILRAKADLSLVRETIRYLESL